MTKNKREQIRIALHNALNMTQIQPIANRTDHAHKHNEYACVVASRALEQLGVEDYDQKARSHLGTPRERLEKILNIRLRK